MAARTPESAAKLQYTQPVAASSEYTRRPSLPTNTRPPTTVGWLYAMMSPGNAKAHFSFNSGTWLGSRPPAAAPWKREFVALLLQPFQFAALRGLENFGPCLHPIRSRSGGFSVPNGLPERYNASARRSAGVRASP